MSIVHDMPGVTRDLISTEVNDDYVLLDTGGIGMELEMTPKQIGGGSGRFCDSGGAGCVVHCGCTERVDGAG